MVKLKAPNEILALGERIVRELNILPHDTLSSWLAHHIAELLLAEKNANDTDRPGIQLQIIETILKICAQRQYLPNVNPLNHLDTVLKKINSLDIAFPSPNQPSSLDDNLVYVWDLLRYLVIHFTIFELSEKADKVEYEDEELSKAFLIQKIETTITALNILKENLSEINSD